MSSNNYWKGLDELDQTEEFVSSNANEFSDGLPLEQAVEKELGESKLDLSQPENLKLFCNTARDIIKKYTQKWIESFNKLNRKIDTSKQYHTSDVEYMNSLWKNFYTLYQKGLIYQSYKVMPYSPKLGCSLSNFEANSNYQEIFDNTIMFKFLIVFIYFKNKKY